MINRYIFREKVAELYKDLHDNEILVTLSADKNNLVVPNGTLARILLNKSVLQNNKYLLTENTKEIISIIKKHMLEQL